MKTVLKTVEKKSKLPILRAVMVQGGRITGTDRLAVIMPLHP